MKSILLVDMDGVLADFEQGFLNIWRGKYPDRPYVPLEERNTFYMEEQYPKEFKSEINEIIASKGFFISLQAKKGGLEAIAEMKSMGNEVFICTAPFSDAKSCHQEKYDWVEKNLGCEWAKKIIFAKDKTLVYGNYLVDDKPEISGIATPAWEHILYDMPYNLHIKHKKRLTWQNWKEILQF